MEQKFAIEDYTVIDLEMTGLSAKSDHVMEIGAARVRNGVVTETYGMLVNPHQNIPERVAALTGITQEMVQNAAEPDEALGGLLDFIQKDVIVGHNVIFDYRFLKQWAVNRKKQLELMACDTLKLARTLLPKEQSKTLEALCVYFAIPRENEHRALDDAIETVSLFEQLKLCAQMETKLSFEQKKQMFEPKLLQYKTKRQTPATKHQVERLKEYRTAHGITEPISWETLTRSEASRKMDMYYSAFGR